MEWNNNRAIECLKEFCFPRLTGTKSLEQARDIIHNQLKRENSEVTIEKYHCRNEYARVMRICGSPFLGVIILIVFLWDILYLLSLFLTLFMLATFIVIYFRLGAFIVSYFFNNKGPINGYNIISKIEAQSEEKMILILGAHYDTKSMYKLEIMVMNFFMNSFFLANLLVIIFSIIRLITGYTAPWIMVVLWIGTIIEFISMAIYFNYISITNLSPGANDNGSGDAVLIELSTIFTKNPPKNLTLMFVFFDGEEIGVQGSSAFAHFHGEDLKKKKTWMINIDTIAGELPLKICLKGGTPTIFHGKEIQETFQNTIKSNEKLQNLENENKIDLNAKRNDLQSDHIPFIIKNIPSAHIESMFIGSHLHTEKDSFNTLIPDSLETCGILFENFIKVLDKSLNINDS